MEVQFLREKERIKTRYDMSNKEKKSKWLEQVVRANLLYRYVGVNIFHNGTSLLCKTLDNAVERMGKSKNDD